MGFQCCPIFLVDDCWVLSLNFDPKLIPFFDSKDSNLSLREWIEKIELICQLSGIKCIECIVPMYLS